MSLNIIISFASLKSSQSSAPYALQKLAGSTILAHILVFLLDLPINKLTLIVGSGREQVESWARRYLPDVPLSVLLVEKAVDPFSALYDCRAELDSEPTLYVSGNFVIEADYLDFVAGSASASCLIQGDQDSAPSELLRIDEAGFLTVTDDARQANWAGSCWFRDGSDLAMALDAVDRRGSRGLQSLLSHLVAQGAQISTKQAVYCLNTQSIESLLNANAWLLRIDHGSEDAIERSYAEDFTVIPPVFLHETAVIENSVIGPYVNLEAEAIVQNSIIRNSLIGAGAQISDTVLTDSMIGENAVVRGQRNVIVVDDGAVIHLGEVKTDHAGPAS